MNVRELFVKLGLDVDEEQWKKGNLAMGVMIGLGNKLVETVGELGKQFVETIKGAAEYGENIEGLAQSAGVTTDAIQRVTAAFVLEGETVNEAAFSLTMLNRAMGEAVKGGGEQAATFKKLGVEVKGADGKLRAADEVFGELVEKFAAMEDGAEKVNLARAVFGRSGAQLVQVLNNGAEALDAMNKAPIMTPEQVKASKEMVTVQRQLASMTQRLWREAVAPLLPAITDLLKQWRDWRKANADVLKQRLQQFLTGAIKAVQWLGKAFAVATILINGLVGGVEAIIAVASQSTTLLYGMAAAIGIIATVSQWAAIKTALAWALAAAPFLLVAAAVAALLLVFDDLRVYAKGGDSMFGRFEKQIREWAKPKGEDPWWLRAIKSFVRLMDEAIKLMDDWQLAVDPAGYAERKAAKNRKQIDAEIQAQNMKVARQRVAMGLPLTDAEKAALWGAGIKEEEFRKRYGSESVDPRLRAPGQNEAAQGMYSPWNVPPPVYASFQPPPPAVTQQSNVFNITQAPGEDSEQFARRVAEIVEEQRSAEYESAAAAVPASGY